MGSRSLPVPHRNISRTAIRDGFNVFKQTCHHEPKLAMLTFSNRHANIGRSSRWPPSWKRYPINASPSKNRFEATGSSTAQPCPPSRAPVAAEKNIASECLGRLERERGINALRTHRSQHTQDSRCCGEYRPAIAGQSACIHC